jgi:hypothetical protein
MLKTLLVSPFAFLGQKSSYSLLSVKKASLIKNAVYLIKKKKSIKSHIYKQDYMA